MSDVTEGRILTREELAQCLDDLRIAGVTDRVTASSAEALTLDHDAALRGLLGEHQDVFRIRAVEAVPPGRVGETDT